MNNAKFMFSQKILLIHFEVLSTVSTDKSINVTIWVVCCCYSLIIDHCCTVLKKSHRFIVKINIHSFSYIYKKNTFQTFKDCLSAEFWFFMKTFKRNTKHVIQFITWNRMIKSKRNIWYIFFLTLWKPQ